MTSASRVNATTHRAQNLERLFEPASVAVLGASGVASKAGGRPIAYLRETGFAGRVYPINPRHASLFGFDCYPSLEALPEVPDLVVVAIPARGVLPAVREAAALGVGAMVIYTSGFAEVGLEGSEVQREIHEICETTGLVVCGPNCQGIANLYNGLAVNFSTALSEGQPKPGPIGIVSQSGLVGALIASECMSRSVGLGYLVSTGNEAGFEIADAISYMAEDKRIRVITGYVESIRDVGRFRAAALKARVNGTPIVLIKSGKSPEAARAAASHTGALAGSARLHEALFQELGIIAVDNLEALIDATLTFGAGLPAPAGRRVAIFGNSGGFNVLCTDDLGRFGLELAPLAEATLAEIARHLPGYLAAQNPIDLATVPQTDPKTTRRLLQLVAEDPNVDIVISVLGAIRGGADALIAELADYARGASKPMVAAWMASAPSGFAALSAAGIPVFPDPSRAARAARHLLDGTSAAAPANIPPARDVEPVSAVVRSMRAAGELTAGEVALLPALGALGLRVPHMARARTPEEAEAAFTRLGVERVAVKIDSPDIAHKTDVGGVVLGVSSPEACAEATRSILASVGTRAKDARIDGVLLAEMARGSAEIVIGIKKDPLLGAFVGVGLGGVFVEILGDIAFRAAPFDERIALALLRQLKGWPLLEGTRSLPLLDVEALACVVAAISQLAAALPEIEELDLNPVLVGRAGEGVTIVDALMRLTPPV
ncbi:acetate--CoA ligase family protein [Neoroseomonas soli]|uniref:Acetate--CoA ligase family protein n=1 Tax=Neoroseomonas soli TaxID=1081025 RepID=A0A9X9WTJ9_9PROT|nr:acetate--CoA ligase family protein [Neoroseomonas soli]MBR0670478.1 acetate--CoA ligase family protein [Neoroseomonas soli]